MYKAKPFALNESRQKTFDTIEDACAYLADETEHDLSPEDWILLGKIVKVNSDGIEFMPKSFFVAKKQQTVNIDMNALL